VEHHHREGQLVDHKPKNPPGIPHTRCHLLPKQAAVGWVTAEKLLFGLS